MLVLALLAAASASAQPQRAVAQAQASVRIARPVTVDEESWERLPKGSRREVVIRDDQGRPVVLRLIEQQ